jgi:hypothetical protein
MSSNIEKESLVDFAEYELDEDQKAAVKTAVVEATYEKAFDEFDKAVGKVGKKAADGKAKKFQAALDEKTAKEAANKEIDDIMKNMSPDQKERMLAAMGVVASPGSALPRVRYDHETTLKSLVKNTEPALALMKPLMDNYEAVVYMGALCDYWKSRITQDRLQINEHAAFKKYFKKVQHLHGLPERGVIEALGDLSFDEEAGAGAD